MIAADSDGTYNATVPLSPSAEITLEGVTITPHHITCPHGILSIETKVGERKEDELIIAGVNVGWRKFIITCTPFLLFLFLGACSQLQCDPSTLKGDMSAEEVLKLCGKPDHINYSHAGRNQQWVYYSGNFLYIDNGRFSDAQWSR